MGISFSKRQEEKQEEEQTRAAEHRDCSSIKRETIPQIFITLCISSFFLLLYKGLVTIESAHQASGCTPPTRRLAIDLGNGHPIKPRAIRRQGGKKKRKEKTIKLADICWKSPSALLNESHPFKNATKLIVLSRKISEIFIFRFNKSSGSASIALTRKTLVES